MERGGERERGRRKGKDAAVRRIENIESWERQTNQEKVKKVRNKGKGKRDKIKNKQITQKKAPETQRAKRRRESQQQREALAVGRCCR